MAWLVEHPPARSQFRCPRREDPSGVVVLHSAENVPDLNPPDASAEQVAKFIQGRSDPGSYHVIADSDSRLRLVDFGCEAYQDGTGSNPHAIAISGAFQASQWETLPAAWRDGVVEQMALAAVEARDWLAARGVPLPAVRISREQSEARVPGFITHAERDPARRSDPGAGCAARVVARYAELIAPVSMEDDMPAAPCIVRDASGHRWVFARGGDWALWAKRDDDAWYRVGGHLTSGPAAAANPNGSIEVTARGDDGSAYVIAFDGAAWDGWAPLGGQVA